MLERKFWNEIRRAAAPWCLALALVLGAQGCGRQPGPRSAQVTLTFASFTATREVYGRDIIPAFQKYWKEKTGQDVLFNQSYEASGVQARAIAQGMEADVAALSLEADIDSLVDKGLVRGEWRYGTANGIASTSVVVIAVRPGNPKAIRDWPDLAKPGVRVLSPDPRTSGGGRWNMVAVYGAAYRGYAGGQRYDKASSEQFLKSVLTNVKVLDKGARESIEHFDRGDGDAAISYESELMASDQRRAKREYVIPRSTVLVENPIAVIDSYADKHETREAAEAFVEFVRSDEAQRSFARHGFRPTNTATATEFAGVYPPVEDLWRIGFLSGWSRATQDLFGDDGAYTRAFEQLHTHE